MATRRISAHRARADWPPRRHNPPVHHGCQILYGIQDNNVAPGEHTFRVSPRSPPAPGTTMPPPARRARVRAPAFLPLPALPTATPPPAAAAAAAGPTMCVQRVNNPVDFAAAMPRAASRALVVFSFVTRNCRACMYASRAYKRLARDVATAEKDVTFCEMDVSEAQNHRLCRELGVNAVPMFQFYKFRAGAEGRGAVGLLDQVVGPTQVGRVREMVGTFASDAFDIEDYVFEDD